MHERNIFLAGIIIRICLLAYGEWQDANFDIKYTDIDYNVYSDASVYVSQGKSPFLRHTYRYTPLLAYALLPNTIFQSFGKLIFILGDLLTGVVISKLLKLHNYNPLYLCI